MKFISNSSYPELDKQILHDEYIDHIRKVRSYNKLTPFYVYALCHPNGEPFYIGKGKSNRAWDHFKEYIIGKTTKNKKKIIDGCIDPPIMYIISGNLDEKTAFNQEKILIETYGRQNTGGQLCNIMPGGVEFSTGLLCSNGGKIGGKITRENKLGIFSPDYDRGNQNRINFSSGLMDHIDFSIGGKLGGDIVVKSKIGIHDPKYADKRKEWSIIGSTASAALGPHGPANKEWRENNPDYIPKGSSSNAKIIGSLLWWNNGVINKKSNNQPGEDFVRGQLQSEKKLQAIRNEHARRNNLKINTIKE